jgi:acetolactate synthase regulatory subunit
LAGGVIKQTVQTDFKTTGAGKVEKDTNRIGKAQTRLGQASASSGRQFSAQAQGLGGLVGAYAGAAATIFALSAAFPVLLNRAARAEQTITGVNALASAVGEQGPKIIRSIQEITKGQLSLVQAAELANLALSSGFSGQQIEQLADISLRASRALGRDLTDSFNRLVRGVTKLEPELLDELGIFVRIEPAAEAYAASIGKVASQLTAFEKRQAFANAVAAEGTEKFASIDTSAETTAESLESLVATLSDIGISVGGFIASVIQPLVEALGKPVTAIASFGILARAVFGRALVELQGSLSKVSDGAESFGDRIGDSIASTKKATQANAAYATSLDSIKLNQTRVSEANRGAFNSLIEGGRAATLNTTQIKQLRDITEVELASVNKSIEAKNRQIATAKAAGRGTKTLEKQLQSLSNRQTNFGNILDSTNSRLKASGPIARGAASSITFLGKAVAGAGRSILGVVAALGTFITIASIIVAVGSTILEAFGWLEPVTEFFKNSTETIRRWLGITKEASQQAKVAKEIANSLVEANEALFITGQRIDSDLH